MRLGGRFTLISLVMVIFVAVLLDSEGYLNLCLVCSLRLREFFVFYLKHGFCSIISSKIASTPFFLFPLRLQVHDVRSLQCTSLCCLLCSLFICSWCCVHLGSPSSLKRMCISSHGGSSWAEWSQLIWVNCVGYWGLQSFTWNSSSVLDMAAYPPVG